MLSSTDRLIRNHGPLLESPILVFKVVSKQIYMDFIGLFIAVLGLFSRTLGRQDYTEGYVD